MNVASIATNRAAAPFNAAALRNAEPAEQRKAVAAQFEAVLVRQLLGKTMTSMLGGEGGGVSGSVFGDMLADTMSQQLTAGQGLGFGRMLERQLAPRSVSPAAETPESQPKTEAK
ncbi:MAG: hypothetical protein V4773_20595 [Verrucomicrobiota bacterium]